MEETLFYVLGGALVVAALAVTALGLKVEGFPGSRAMTAALLAVFALLVGGTTTFAWLQAEEEQEHREAEEAEAAEEEPADETGAGEVAAEGRQDQPEDGSETTLELSAPEDGTLAFEPEQLTAKQGEVTIEFTNPAPLEHDVVLEDEAGEVLAKSDLVRDGASTSVSAPVESGQYRFFCDVPGHEEAGMEGTLTVD